MKPNEVAKINQLYKQIDEQNLTINHLQDRLRVMQSADNESKNILELLQEIKSAVDKIGKNKSSLN